MLLLLLLLLLRQLLLLRWLRSLWIARHPRTHALSVCYAYLSLGFNPLRLLCCCPRKSHHNVLLKNDLSKTQPPTPQSSKTFPGMGTRRILLSALPLPSWTPTAGQPVYTARLLHDDTKKAWGNKN